MNRQSRRLITDVAHVLKVICETSSLPYNNGKGKDTTVKYDFSENRAYIFINPHILRTGNGHERYFNFVLINQIAELSKKYNISYKIGMTDSFELHLQIY